MILYILVLLLIGVGPKAALVPFLGLAADIDKDIWKRCLAFCWPH